MRIVSLMAVAAVMVFGQIATAGDCRRVEQPPVIIEQAQLVPQLMYVPVQAQAPVYVPAQAQVQRQAFYVPVPAQAQFQRQAFYAPAPVQAQRQVFVQRQEAGQGRQRGGFLRLLAVAGGAAGGASVAGPVGAALGAAAGTAVGDALIGRR